MKKYQEPYFEDTQPVYGKAYRRKQKKECNLKFGNMTELELNSYRFISGKEPTDEMLETIMHEAAVEAKNRNEQATERYISQMKRDIEEKQKYWGPILATLNHE